MSAADKNEEFRTEYRHRIHVEYVRQLNLDDIADTATRDYLRETFNGDLSHKIRILRTAQMMKHSYILDRASNAAVCFRATRDGQTCIYGFVHSKWNPRKKTFRHTYMCSGPTFQSQDGEYRDRLLEVDEYTAFFKKYAETLEPVERLITTQIAAGEIQLQADFFWPHDLVTPHTAEFADSINTGRYAIKLYMMAWIYDYHRAELGTLENHINPTYAQLFHDPADRRVYRALLSAMGEADYMKMCFRAVQYYYDFAVDSWLIEPQVGQKIFPVTIFEAIRRDDIQYAVWREMYIQNILSNLSLNLISPAFPFLNNWTYIQGAHVGLFDNPAMHEKYDNSTTAESISQQIRVIDKYNYIEQERSRGPINNKFARLSRSMQKSIVYADSDIRLTNLAVCVTSEYVGRTLRDIPAVGAADPEWGQVFTDSAMFARHMFEYVYAFYCMNSKCAVIHADLHMNNATIARRVYMTDTKGRPPVSNPQVVFILAPDQLYMFPNDGFYSSIIDFSRSILGDYGRVEHEFSANHAEIYFKEQNVRMLYVFHYYFPDLFKQYRDTYESLLLNNLPLVFKILTALDTYALAYNLRNVLAEIRGGAKPGAAGMKLLGRLSAAAKKSIEDNLAAVAAGAIGMPEDIEWPNLIILQKYFAAYLVPPGRLTAEGAGDIHVVDIFNAGNDLVYDAEDRDTWGPLLSLDVMFELYKKYDIKTEPSLQRWLRHKHADETDRLDAIVAPYEKQESEVLQFEPWMLI